MKKTTLLLLLAIIALVTVSCNSGNSGTTASGDSKAAVCIWDNVPLKDAPGESGKWLSSISIGETATYLGDTKEEKTDKKSTTYIKIRLKDGKEGWAQGDLVVLKSKPAAIVESSEIYSRPNLLNKTGKSFSKMDIIAVKSEKDGFIEVVGKRKDGKWIENGWLKPKGITYDEVDIAVAKFATKALEISDSRKREEAINEIVNNTDFNNSVFISSLPKQEKKVDESATDTTKQVQ
jgi:hypothetical protein